MSATATDMELDFVLDELVDEPTICESHYCESDLKKPSHEAHYLSRFPDCCGWRYQVCQQRVEMFRTQPQVICNCGGIVNGNTIVSVPLSG